MKQSIKYYLSQYKINKGGQVWQPKDHVTYAAQNMNFVTAIANLPTWQPSALRTVKISLSLYALMVPA